LVGKIQVALHPISILFGVQGIRVFINDQLQETIQFGGVFTADAHPGQYSVHVELLGVVNRSSKQLLLNVEDGMQVNVEGKYSRVWGNIKLRLVN
jgi:hypothetical protein